MGYNYDSVHDTISLKCKSLNFAACTKRSILSAIASIFDPLGLINPFLINTKILMREIYLLKVDWDKTLPDDICMKWKGLCTEYELLKDIKFPRQAFNKDYPVDLVVFCDASTAAFCCTIYALNNGCSNLIFSKVKIAPTVRRTLPSLELLAVHLGFKCAKEIISNENFSNINFRSLKFVTDSQVALAWLLSEKANRKNIFVNNRLKEISLFKKQLLDKVSIVNFKFVPSESNIADICTRSCKVKTFFSNINKWKYGPEWILLDECKWPSGQLGCIPSSHRIKEQFVNFINVEEPLIDIDSFSSYSALLKRTETVILAATRFQGLKLTKAEVLSRSFNYLIKEMQRSTFSAELEYLLLDDIGSNIRVPKLVPKFNLFIDENGVIRSKGRIAKSLTCSYDVINPVLMSPNHHLTSLFISYSHIQCKHMGLDSTLNYLRQGGVWILKARHAIKKVLNKCFICKRYNNLI